MSRVVLLDTGVLAEVVRQPGHVAGDACRRWMLDLLTAGDTVCVPEIADYELRRELIRAGRSASVRRLDQLAVTTSFLPIDRRVMLRAAELWAQVRAKGRPTADPAALDGDVILAAHHQVQVTEMVAAGDFTDAAVATTNVGHLSLMVPADLWQNI